MIFREEYKLVIVKKSGKIKIIRDEIN